MPGARGGVYDPLLGLWMTPRWEGILDRVNTPSKMHLYRFNGNDPVNDWRDNNMPENSRQLLTGKFYVKLETPRFCLILVSSPFSKTIIYAIVFKYV